MARRSALVTGGARGIGLAIAKRLTSDGIDVLIADIDLEEAQVARRMLMNAGGNVRACRLDVTDSASADSAVAEAVIAYGRLDILVNNAGIAGRSVPTHELTDGDWRTVNAVDLDGVFYCSRAAVRQMLNQASGRIVNIASVAGKEGNPNAVPYSAAKAGVIGLTKAMAKEVATSGILINCVTPAVVESEILRQMSPEHVAYMLSKIPLGRMGRAEEVAALVAWLVSAECSFSTGAVFDLSGGRATY